MQFPKLCVLALAAALGLAGCKKDKDSGPTGPVTLEFNHKVGDLDLDLTKSKAAYKTVSGDSFRVTRFIYYVSNLRFNKAGGGGYAVPNSYYLINEADAASQRVALADVPTGDYTSLSFVVGVDSVRNRSGAQTGALDQGNGMFWVWDTGYIFLKLEGNYVQPGVAVPGALSIHVGGSRWPANTIRTVTLPLPAGTVLAVRGARNPKVRLAADVLRLFDGTAASGTTAVSFSGRPGTTRLVSTTSGPDAVTIANNYARPVGGVFRVESVVAD